MRCLLLVAALALGVEVRGQELLWTVHDQFPGWGQGIENLQCMRWFGDYDGDGAEDLLVYAVDHACPTICAELRVFSGVDGVLLAQMPTIPLRESQGVGDFDLDGVPDVAVYPGIAGGNLVEVWSIATNTRLFHAPASPTGSFNLRISGNLDCNGDGWPDIIYIGTNLTIYVHDHFGPLLYSIQALPFGLFPSRIAGVGDLDGDGGDDFIVGCAESVTGFFYGAVVLVSGRTGTPLRIHWGAVPGSGVNRDVSAAGDVDGDGVMDYAAGNQDAPSGVVMIWSGATGALLRQWVVPVAQLTGAFIAGHDVDLDGRPDIIDVAGTPLVSGFSGRVRTLSTRDGQDLVGLSNLQVTFDDYADLGVQPGNPYPVFAVMDNPMIPPYPNWPRIRAYRCSPVGTRFVGSGCTSTGTIPTIGIRRVDATPTDHARLVLGSAPATAFAVCVAAPTSLALNAPVPLDFLGLPGCNLLVAPAILELRLTGAAGMDRGYAAFDFPAAMAATGGVEFAAQWVVLDPATLQFATTARYEFRVQ